MKGTMVRLLFTVLVVIPVLILATLTPIFGESGVRELLPSDLNLMNETDWASIFELIKKNQKDFQVESVDEFKAITKYYDDRIHDGTEVHRFRLKNSDTIQCILIHTQGALTSLGIKPEDIQLAPQTEPIDTTSVTPQSEQINVAKVFGLDGSSDENGNLRTCPEGSFPRLMPKLENLYRFQRLRDIYRKYPDGTISSIPGGTSAPPHEYAHAAMWANNIGSSAIFNIWAPYVQTPSESTEFSLSQLWVIGGTGDNLQTAETGWQVCPNHYRDAQPHLFIYYTTNDYKEPWGDFSGCYNLECKGFVQTNSNVIIGGPLSTVSTTGGNQYDIKLMYYLDATKAENWWLMVGNQWVGYYPDSLYNSQGLAHQSPYVDYGGEIVNSSTGGLHTTTQMGSGRFPNEGREYAAYIRKLQYVDLNNILQDSVGLIKATKDSNGVDNSMYYDLILSSSSDSNWLQYFYFGGPGRVTSTTPDLIPYQPSGWSDKIVVSNKTGCRSTSCIDNNPLYTTDTLYVDWAVINSGSAATTATFYTQLYVDGALKNTWQNLPPLKPNYSIFVPDYSIGSFSAGGHSIKIVADSTGAMNGYTKTITVNTSGPDLTGSWATCSQTCKTTKTGHKCTIKGTFTVSDIGNRDAGSTYVNFYLSNTSSYQNGDTQLKSVSTGKLKAGKGKTITLSYNLPTGQNASGKYVIGFIDQDNLIGDINRGNKVIPYGPIP